MHKISFLQKAALIPAVLLFSVLCAYSQINFEKWKVHSSLQQTNSVSYDSRGKIWAAGSGGVFCYDKNNGSYLTFNNQESLQSINISALSCDRASNKIFFGSVFGHLDILTEDLQWKHFADILKAKYPNPRINKILVHEGKAYIGGGFGLTVFDIEKEIFIETPEKFGSFQKNTSVNDIIVHRGDLWVATDQGAAKASLSSYLSFPDSWTNFTIDNGLPEIKINKLAASDEELYIASERNISLFNSDSFDSVISIDEYQIKDIAVFESKLYYATTFHVLDADGDYYWDKWIYDLNALEVYSHGGEEFLLVSIQEGGIGILQNKEIQNIYPNSPSTNRFKDMDCDLYGNLWVATESDASGRGFMKLSPSGEWHNYTLQKFPGIKTNGYWAVNALEDGKVVFGTWGAGMMILDQNLSDTNFTFWDNSNSVLKPIASSSSYTICGGSATDNFGNLCVVNYGETSEGPVYATLDANNSWQGKTNCVSARNRWYSDIVIDSWNTRWISAVDGDGLLYINETEDVCGIITTSNSGGKLMSNTQNSIELDRSGYLWIGTPDGLTVFINPSSVLSSSASKIMNAPQNFRDVPINDIYVDALNYKWIATNEGIYVLDQEGIEIVQSVNTSNSPLISDKVVSITGNPKTGTMFFGTASGLSQVNTLSVEPLPDYSIECYPQPFKLKKHNQMIISGLAANSQIKILTGNGQFVKTIHALGRKVFWDGTDSNGDAVASGVYLIVATSETSDKKAVAKIAVIGE